MAYIKVIIRMCQTCGKHATREVFNNRNSSYGYFCAACAQRRLKQLIQEETI